jgi:TonB family protein
MFGRAIMLKPDWAQAFADRALALYQSKRYTEAISDSDAAIRLDPTRAGWYDLRGRAYSYSGQHARALDDYNRAIDMNSNVAVYYNNRGWAYRELGQPEKAIADLTTAIQMSPGYALGYENRAIAFVQLKDWARAIADYTAAILLNPTKWNYQKRAEAKVAIGDQTGADEDQRKVAELDSAVHDQNQGVYRVGNGVSAPAVLYKVDPEYPEEARRAKISGTVVMLLIVDASGNARDIKVVRSLGLGLDEKAIEAVNKWKFRPGYKNGQAVAVQATIQVNFRLFKDAKK